MGSLHRQGAIGGGWLFVHDLIARNAGLAPHQPALMAESGQRVSYGELRHRVDGLASRLIAVGVRPDERVAVYMERSVDLVVAMCAVLQAGGVYVPIDPSNPATRTAALLRSIRASAVIADRPLPADDRGSGAEVLAVRSDQASSGAAAVANAHLRPDHLAYLLFTSGSTGVPKGVAMPHRGLSRLIAWQAQSGSLGLRTLQFTSMSFDVTFQEVLSTLATGGELVLVDEALRRDPERLLPFLDERNVERIFLPYVALQQLAKASERTGIVPRALRHVVVAGERLIMTEAITRLFRGIPVCRLDNHYGPTEAHLVTSLTLTGDPAGWPVLPAIGHAVDGVRLALLDEQLEPVADGQVGELYVSGDCLARGYVDAAALTAERFLPDPNGPGRMYKTGDLVQVGDGGALRFIGRADTQLKVRGHRVEPAEVEACLVAHADIREAVVDMRTLTGGLDVLVAYLVCDRRPGAAELSRHVGAALPSYMVPSRFVFVDALPLSSNGKVDRLRLRAIDLPETAAGPVAGPALADEIRAIWERVLGHDEIGADDDFFDVGGDSLLATWVVAELGQVVGRPLELSTMLRDSTINGLARTLVSQAAQSDQRPRESEIITLRAGPARRVLYLLHPLGGELLAYRALASTMCTPMRVLGIRWRPDPADARKLTLQEIAATHCAQLRTVQPLGPYLLAGWSFGGVLAYELAQQLLAAGQAVEFLGLLDANPLRDPITGLRTAETPHLETLDRVVEVLDNNHEAVGALIAEPAVRRLLGGVAAGLAAPHLRRNLDVARTSMRAAVRYRPARYPGPIDVFRAIDAPPRMRDLLADDIATLAAGRLVQHDVPGDHSSMLAAPNVEVMARALDRALSREGKP